MRDVAVARLSMYEYGLEECRQSTVRVLEYKFCESLSSHRLHDSLEGEGKFTIINYSQSSCISIDSYRVQKVSSFAHKRTR